MARKFHILRVDLDAERDGAAFGAAGTFCGEQLRRSGRYCEALPTDDRTVLLLSVHPKVGHISGDALCKLCAREFYGK